MIMQKRKQHYPSLHSDKKVLLDNYFLAFNNFIPVFKGQEINTFCQRASVYR